jgi:hypothetical protein
MRGFASVDFKRVSLGGDSVISGLDDAFVNTLRKGASPETKKRQPEAATLQNSRYSPISMLADDEPQSRKSFGGELLLKG